MKDTNETPEIRAAITRDIHAHSAVLRADRATAYGATDRQLRELRDAGKEFTEADAKAARKE